MSEKVIFNIDQIKEIIPHREPFLLVDRIVELVDDQSIVAMKEVKASEDYFKGHFPGYPVMPGVLILEAMAQASAILAKVSTNGIPRDKLILLIGADEMRWRKQVVPGDTLRIEMTFHKKKRPLWFMKGQVTVDGKLVASGIISAAETDA